ncbi:MAG: LytTR family transcriptional regulator DNA-binding domain-containing protein [Flavobacteriales bacterium]|nr:LytTR family transcriptional regulator DNA-binding domain-containing protein [Flavobacteriales bacterium]
MNALLRYCKRPYPLHVGWAKALRQGFIFGLLVGAFLVFFRPFGLYSVDRKYDYVLWGFGAVTFLATLFNDGILPKLLPSFFHERKWNTGKEIAFVLYHIWFIGTANFAYLLLLTTTKLIWTAYGQICMYTLGIGLFPVVLGIAIRQRQLFDRYSGQAEQIHPTQPTRPDVSAVVISGKNDNEQLELPAQNLLYLEAEGNYVIVGFEKDGALQKEMLRSTLRELLEQLNEHPSLEQVHRSFVANLDRVDRVTGNSQGLQLHFGESGVEIPVSRRKVPEIKELLEHTVRP